MSQISILIADNNESFTGLLEESLSMSPDMKIVGIAKDGLQTMELIESAHPDILLLDIVMPGADGLEVLRKMRSLAHKPHTFVISALGDRETIDRAIQLGADYYFIKPLNTKTVLMKIRECMGS